jgi:hypothetical protein
MDCRSLKPSDVDVAGTDQQVNDKPVGQVSD